MGSLHAGNVILFQIKVFAGNIKETTLAKYFIKVTARPSLTRLRVIRRINRVHENMEIENMLQRFSCISILFKLSLQLSSDFYQSIPTDSKLLAGFRERPRKSSR